MPAENDSSSIDASWRTTARRLLSPRRLRDSLTLTSPPSPRIAVIAGLQAALSLLAATLLISLTPWHHLIGFPALGALASLFGRYASARHRARIVAICAILLTVAVFVPSLASYGGASSNAKLLLLALIAGCATLAVAHWQLGGPGPVIFTFAAAGGLAPLGSWHSVAEQTLATAAGGAVAWAVCRMTDRLRSAELASLNMPVAPHRPFRHELIAAARLTAGAATAALVAQAIGWQHPAWAAIGALAVMQGGHLHITMSRALQRMAGTIIGAFIAWVILSQPLPPWGLIAIVAAFQFITEAVIGYNYALGQITVTPMALIMTYLAAPATAANMPVERVLETLLGAGLGIVFAVMFSTVDDRVYLARRRDSR